MEVFCMEQQLQQQLNFIMEVDRMKTIYRKTLVMDRSREETDAEHSWHLALAAMILAEHAEAGTDINKAIRMALVHDLVEIYAGDTFAYDEQGNATKTEREQAAAEKIFNLLPVGQAPQVRVLWEEFERMDTQEALYAAALDRLLPFISNHLTEGHTWRKHGVSAAQIYHRMQPVKKALPGLWDYIEQVVGEAVEKGYVII
jgi:putative hydrolase of HD superfamily